jgi:hypothetical protein
MGRGPNYLVATVLLGAGAIIGDAALDNLEYVRETTMDASKWHEVDGESRMNVPIRDEYKAHLYWGLGELVIAAPFIALGIGAASRGRDEN